MLEQQSQSELSIEPTKLQRLDFGSIISNSQQKKQNSLEEEYKTVQPVVKQRDPSPQFDYTLGASVYNGDKPIPKPPSTKPVHLGSLNFSTLKSNESKTSTSQSFKLPRLMLLNMEISRYEQKTGTDLPESETT